MLKSQSPLPTSLSRHTGSPQWDGIAFATSQHNADFHTNKVQNSPIKGSVFLTLDWTKSSRYRKMGMNFLADSVLSIKETFLPFSLPSGRHTNDWDCSGFLWDPLETLYLLPTPDGSTCERKRWWDEAWTPEGLSSRKHITRIPVYCFIFYLFHFTIMIQKDKLSKTSGSLANSPFKDLRNIWK